MRSASMLRAAISLRAAAQRRSSSVMEIGVSTRSSPDMVSSFGVLMSAADDVAHALGLPRREGREIVDQQRQDLLAIGVAHAADVGGEEDVGHLPERTVL